MQGRCAMAAALQGGLRMRCGGGGGQGTEGAVGRCLEAQRGPTSLDEGMGHGAMKLWGYGACRMPESRPGAANSACPRGGSRFLGPPYSSVWRICVNTDGPAALR